MQSSKKSPLTSFASEKFVGTPAIPGDKSISHRSLMLGALCIGQTTISGLLTGEDVMATRAALAQMGVAITEDNGNWIVNGVGINGLSAPQNVLDMGNSGTSTRLLMGVLAGYDFPVFITGDASLRKRPMGRVVNPLTEMGVRFTCTDDKRLPLCMRGSQDLLTLDYTLPMPSAQVKSAVLLAGLNAAGTTVVRESIPTRDHTENMLRAMGADITSKDGVITLKGQPMLTAGNITVPADPSSAAFLMVAGLVVPNSHLTLKNVCLNPTRTGLIDTLLEMGGDIDIANRQESAGEPVGDIIVKSSKLRGITVPAARAASMIDEYPILCVAASHAQGDTIMEGLHELRVKECDRLQVMHDELNKVGITARITDNDDLIVSGGKANGGTVKTHLDHRIAMSFLVLGLISENGITIDDSAPINTSFPGFVDMLQGLGGNIQ